MSGKFDYYYYHQQASDRCGNSIYKLDSWRACVHRKTIHDEEAPSVMDEKSGQEKFKLNTFLAIMMDQLKSSLRKRINA